MEKECSHGVVLRPTATHCLDRGRCFTRAEPCLAIVTWIERTYHRLRYQRTLGRLNAIDFELLHTSVANRGPKFTPRESLNPGSPVLI